MSFGGVLCCPLLDKIEPAWKQCIILNFQIALFYKAVLFLSHRCRLLLNSVHEDDSGAYTCKLSTAKGTGKCIFTCLPVSLKYDEK